MYNTFLALVFMFLLWSGRSFSFPGVVYSPAQTSAMLQLFEVYGKLTSHERRLLLKHPFKMINVYDLSVSAEKMCSELFPVNNQDDESDACRHFVWSALLYNKFGEDFSLKVLWAHEEGSINTEEQKAMDMHNNKLGFDFSARLLGLPGGFEKQKLIPAFLNHLKSGSFIVLKESLEEYN